MLVSVVCMTISFHIIVVMNNYQLIIYMAIKSSWTQVAAYWHKEIYKHNYTNTKEKPELQRQ